MKILISILFLTSISYADQKTFESSPEAVHLIELYSSEGCSSCPPAERWLAQLKSNKQLWKSFIPIEFHVDYWNRLGWIDPFSHKQFTQRQRNYSREWKKNKVYTPGFVLNGDEWTLGQQKIPKRSEEKVGVLRVVKNKDAFEVEFKPVDGMNKKYEVYGAFLGQGLKTEVPRGENAGKILNHEFVVLSLSKNLLTKSESSYNGKIKVKENKKAKAQSYSFAFWVTEKNSLKPIQATGGPLK